MLLPSKHFTPPIAIAKKKLKKHYTSPYCPFSFSYFPFPFRVETCRPCTLKGNVYACGNIRLGSPALCVHHNISSFSADCNKAFLFLLATTTFSSLYLHIIYIYIYIAMNPIYAYIYTHSLSLSSIPSFTTKLLIQKDIDPLLHHAYCLKLCDSSYHCFNIQAEAVWAS